MYIIFTKRIVQLTRHRIGLTDFLRLQAFALEHIIEVGVAANIQLHRPFQLNPALAKESCQHAMHNRCSDLTFDIVTDHRQVRFLESLLPVFFTSNKHGNTVDETHTRLDNLLNIPLGGSLRANWQVVYHYICAGIIENLDNISCLPGCFGNHLREIFAQPIMGHPSIDLRSQFRHIGETIGIIWRGIDRLIDSYAAGLIRFRRNVKASPRKAKH